MCEEIITHFAFNRFLKEYDCIEPIGSGGFGHVYKARLKHLDVDYAVKIVPNKK